MVALVGLHHCSAYNYNCNNIITGIIKTFCKAHKFGIYIHGLVEGEDIANLSQIKHSSKFIRQSLLTLEVHLVLVHHGSH